MVDSTSPSARQNTTAKPRLMPGDFFKLDGESWVVAAWVTETDGERQLFATPAANPSGGVARWPFKMLQEMLAP